MQYLKKKQVYTTKTNETLILLLSCDFLAS